MRSLGALLFITAVAALTINGQEELGHVRTSRELANQSLGNMGIQVGCDAKRGRMVATATRGCSLKHEEPDEELGFTETYDFPDDTTDDFETRRFKAVWKAYADGLAEIATQMGISIEHEEEKKDAGRVLGETMHSSASGSLAGVVFLTMAESFNDGCYEVTVAVCQSKKREETYSRGLTGGEPSLGKYSLVDWIELTVDKGAGGIICPQSFCDNEGVWWRVAGVPVELDAGRSSKKVVMSTEKAKRYAYEAAMRTLAVRVSARTSSTSKLVDKGADDLEVNDKVERMVKIEPMNTVLPIDPSHVQWFEVDKVNVFTGKPVRCVVAALRSGKGIARSERKTEVGNGSLQNGTALVQAKAYLEQKGWRTGREFLKTRGFAVAIGGAAFKCTSLMDGVAFAQKRNDAVRQALLESAMNIAFTYGCRGDLKMSLSAGDSKMQQSYVADDEAGERIVRDGISFCDDSDTVVDLKNQGFMWWASFSSLSAENSERERKSVKKVEGCVKSEMPIHGLKVERQFESIVDGVYQIAFVVTCNPKRGRDIGLSFGSEKSRDEWGKLPLGQWVAEQDFGMAAGPRQYVDDKGNVWMIGIAPAAEGCRPFGSSLDGMAREYAAFGLSGDVKASYAISSLKGPAGEYSERKAEILYSAESSPTGKNYPKEFEFVFHRAFTHPLTGREGVASICALRSGTRGAVEKLMVEQMKENLARAKEQGRKKGIRDSLLQKANGQFQ